MKKIVALAVFAAMAAFAQESGASADDSAARATKVAGFEKELAAAVPEWNDLMKSAEPISLGKMSEAMESFGIGGMGGDPAMRHRSTVAAGVGIMEDILRAKRSLSIRQIERVKALIGLAEIDTKISPLASMYGQEKCQSIERVLAKEISPETLVVYQKAINWLAGNTETEAPAPIMTARWKVTSPFKRQK